MIKKIIEVKNLVKDYNGFKAVKGISFDVHKGEVFGLLGENGAGKTTTLEIIEGLRKPTSGNIIVLGEDTTKGCLDVVKERIGVQLQSSAYYDFLTVREILDLFGSFYSHKKDPSELLEMVDLQEKSNSLVGSLSGGQKQRFSIVASLVNDPEIVFLDEPTTGLDPLARRNLWELITKIKKQGKTIILTTHYMEEAEVLCDRIAIMEKGEILVSGETHKLIENSKNPFMIDFVSNKMTDSIKLNLNKLGDLKPDIGRENSYEFRFPTQEKLLKALDIVRSINPESLIVGRATLEDLFIELTGKMIGDNNV